MANPEVISPDAPGQSAEQDFGYVEAKGATLRAQRKERAGKIAELRRQADGARERAKKAQARFERAVVLESSAHPERVDWYEYPGELPRKQLLEAARLNTTGLHRIMERYRKERELARKRRNGR
jgi:hypothetical protein